MPIVRINDDGTVRIAKKSGKDPIDVRPEDLAKYNPALVEDYNKISKEIKTLESGGEPEVAKDDPFKMLDTFVNTLEQRYGQAGGGEYGGVGARISGAKKSVKGMLGLDDSAKAYKDAREGFAATLKSLTGDTGVLTQQDYERLVKLIPGLTSTPGEATIKFEDLRGQLAAKFGKQASESTYQAPESKGGAAAALAPGLTELYKQKQRSIEGGGLGEVAIQSAETAIPALNFLLKPKEGGGRELGYNAPAGAAAGEVMTAVQIGNLFGKLRGGVNPISKAGEARTLAGAEAEAGGNAINPEQVANKMREKIISDTSITQKTKTKLLQQVEQFATQKDPISIQQSIGDFMRADAYTKGGTRLKGFAGKYAGYLRETYKDIWKDVAPEVLEQTKKMAKAYSVKKGLLNTLRLTGATAGGIGGGMYLYNLLRGKSGQ